MAQTAPKRPGRPKKEEPLFKDKIYTIEKGGGILFRIRPEAIVFDQETGLNRGIRYCPNESSIFTDEQSSSAVRSQVLFTDGLLLARSTEQNLQKFLDMHPMNKANGGGIFSEVNNEVKAEQDIDQEFLTHDAISLVRNKSIDELMPVVIYLGIDQNQKNAEIKRELLISAKINPKKFIELFDNPIVEARSIVMRSIDYQLVKVNDSGAFWADSGRLIVASPAGQDSVTVLSQFCLTEKGSTTYETLRKELDKIEG